MMKFEDWVLKQTHGLKAELLKSNLELLDQGLPIPYLAYYCKDKTGNLSEDTLFELQRNKQRWGELIKKQKSVKNDLKHQKKLSGEFKELIENTFEFDQLDNLHIPYKRKRPKPQIAKDAGLEPLAFWIWQYCHDEFNPLPKINLHQQAANSLNIKHNIKTAEDAINGAKEILIERLSEDLNLRKLCRLEVRKKGHLRCKKGKEADDKSRYAKFFNFQEKLEKLQNPRSSYKYLQVRRAWAAKELTNSIGPIEGQNNYEDDLLKKFEETAAPKHKDSDPGKILLACAHQSLKVWVLPEIETEVHRDLKTLADRHIIHEACENLRKLLMSSPFGTKNILGIDPHSKSASIVASIDASGKIRESFPLDLSDPEKEKVSLAKLKTIYTEHNIQAISIGNDSAGRTLEAKIKEALKEERPLISLTANELANIYGNSKTAKEEFPDLDSSTRRAISLARRFQDPLLELIKLDPKLLSPVQFSSDVLMNPLRRALSQVITSCICSIMPNLNYASSYALAYLPGLNHKLAKMITDYRKEKGPFKSRSDLLKVEGMTQNIFKACAGFLQVPISDNPLDHSRVHPDHYEPLKDIAIKQKLKLKELFEKGAGLIKRNEELASKIGKLAFADLINALTVEDKGPRKPFRSFKFRPDISSIHDVKKDMECPGIVSNVTEFGAFVDIGVSCDGLVHSSHMAKTFVKNPKGYLSPGDRVSVKIIEVNIEKNQIGLTMNFVQKKPARPKKNFKKGPRKPVKKEAKVLTHNPFAALAGQFKAS